MTGGMLSLNGGCFSCGGRAARRNKLLPAGGTRRLVKKCSREPPRPAVSDCGENAEAATFPWSVTFVTGCADAIPLVVHLAGGDPACGLGTFQARNGGGGGLAARRGAVAG